jgi:ubiquinone/menaquinone biosynthesis C-methylase UbiE
MAASAKTASPRDEARPLEGIPNLPPVTEEARESMRGHRWFAALYDRLSAPVERRYTAQVREDVAGGAAGRVLEVGAGTGLNFPYYRRARVTNVVATEPDPFMLRRAEQRAAEAAGRIQLVRAPAERLPFAAGAFDAVVCTLVLCSVADQRAALTEIYRVLRSGGELRFYEHVRFDGRLAALLQDAATPLWSRVFAGCHVNRATADVIPAAGFELVTLEERNLPTIPPFAVARRHVKGLARKPAEEAS